MTCKTIALLLTFLLLGQASAQNTVAPGDLSVRLKTAAAWNPVLNLGSEALELTPTDVVPLDDGTGRLLIATLGGTIRVFDQQAGLLDEPLFNSQQSGLQLQQESGTTGIAVHPNFAGNPDEFGYGKLYTITTENGASNSGLSPEHVDFAFAGEVHQDVIREWDFGTIVGNAAQNSLPSLSVSDSREILRVAQPGPFHNLTDITFDLSLEPTHSDFGQLYISGGDGGNSSANASTNATRRQAAQDLSSIYGNVLRINPNPDAHSLVRNNANTNLPAYSISPVNPFAGDELVESREADTLAEIFAYGLRSPFRLNIDSLEGTITFGDVGEQNREEMSVVTPGSNSGWGRFEGTRQDNDFVELAGPAPHSPPVFEYGRDVGRSVIGGTVYRGSTFPELFGKYVFGDFGQSGVSARLFYGTIDPTEDSFGQIFEFDLGLSEALFPVSIDEDDTIDGEAALPDRLFSIGEDENGELLLIGGQDPRSAVSSVEGAFLIRLTRGLGCDTSGDGLCTIDDLNALVLARNRDSDDLLFDIDWDDALDGDDVSSWLEQASIENDLLYRVGDTNLDGDVDFADFLSLSLNFGNPEANWTQGNYDGQDGTQFADFLALSANFGAVATPQNVPEPNLRVYTLLAFIVLGRKRPGRQVASSSLVPGELRQS